MDNKQPTNPDGNAAGAQTKQQNVKARKQRRKEAQLAKQNNQEQKPQESAQVNIASSPTKLQISTEVPKNQSQKSQKLSQTPKQLPSLTKSVSQIHDFKPYHSEEDIAGKIHRNPSFLIQASTPTMKLEKDLPTIKQSIFSQIISVEINHEKIFSDTFGYHDIHPDVLKFISDLPTNKIVGTTDLILRFFTCIKSVIDDYFSTNSDYSLNDLRIILSKNFKLMTQSQSIQLMLKHYYDIITQKILEMRALPNNSIKNQIDRMIDTTMDNISLTHDDLINQTADTIKNGDTILTYGLSKVVIESLIRAKDNKKTFKVILISNKSETCEENLKLLVDNDISVTYGLINSINYFIRNVSKVIIESYTILSNGASLGYSGCATICMVAAHYEIPVLICAESYLFQNAIYLDSICTNELDLDRPSQSVNESPVLDELYLKYDVTAAKYITAIISEIRLIPPTSVPVFRKEYKFK